MDIAKLILTQPVSPPRPLKNLSKIDDNSEERKKQIAKDFESLLVNKLLDEMKNTIGDWGFEKDGVSTQIQGIFSLYLSRHIANNGGFGLWKDIYEFLTRWDQKNAAMKSPDKNI